jgi:hypothetical protein
MKFRELESRVAVMEIGTYLRSGNLIDHVLAQSLDWPGPQWLIFHLHAISLYIYIVR